MKVLKARGAAGKDGFLHTVLKVFTKRSDWLVVTNLNTREVEHIILLASLESHLPDTTRPGRAPITKRNL